MLDAVSDKKFKSKNTVDQKKRKGPTKCYIITSLKNSVSETYSLPEPSVRLDPEVFAVQKPPRAADDPSWLSIVPDALKAIDFELLDYDDAMSWNAYSDDDGVFDAVFGVLNHFLPKKITACDNPEKQASGFRFKKEAKAGVRYRFWCTWAYPQEEKRKATKLLTIDIDRKNAQLAWKEASLPRPFLVIRNRVFWQVPDDLVA